MISPSSITVVLFICVIISFIYVCHSDWLSLSIPFTSFSKLSHSFTISDNALMLVVVSLFVQTKSSVKTNCGTTSQLWGGIKYGIEQSLHVLQEVWLETDGWEHKGDIPKRSTVPSVEVIAELELATDECAHRLYHPPDHVALESESTYSWYESNTGIGSLLIDATNVFNQLSRYYVMI